MEIKDYNEGILRAPQNDEFLDIIKIMDFNLKKCLLICLPIILVGLPVAISGAFLLAYQNKIYPKTQAGGVKLDGLTINQAEKELLEVIGTPNQLIVTDNQSEWKIGAEKINLAYDFMNTAEKAYQQSRKLPATNWLKQTNISLVHQFNEQALEAEIATIAGQINQEPIPAQINFDPEIRSVQVNQGKLGKKVKIDDSKQRIINQIKIGKIEQPIPLLVSELNQLPTEKQLESAKVRAENLIGQNLTLTSSKQNFIIEDKQLINFVGFQNHWEKEKISEYLEIVAESIHQEAENAKFDFKDGHVKAFRPSQNGVQLDKENAGEKIITGLENIITTNQPQTLDLPLIETEPEIKTGDTNRLGISSLLGTGDSFYRGSSASRIHNIDLSSSKLHGVLIEPGATFSFNQTVGEITQRTGYQQAYIIKEGQTILGSGGGVCQVSTTIFRAALESGLPIIERQPHAYRVSYYEQDTKPGFDATVYHPSPDLKFKNDTSGYILIQREINKENRYLAFKFYGTDDGRQAIIDNIRVWDVIPPPEPKYIDDPSLAPGETRRIESPAWGTKSAFDWRVVKDNEVLHEKTFFSHYQTWQAVYLRGIEN